jgi:hypothetical protein
MANPFNNQHVVNNSNGAKYVKTHNLLDKNFKVVPGRIKEQRKFAQSLTRAVKK